MGGGVLEEEGTRETLRQLHNSQGFSPTHCIWQEGGNVSFLTIPVGGAERGEILERGRKGGNSLYGKDSDLKPSPVKSLCGAW